METGPYHKTQQICHQKAQAIKLTIPITHVLQSTSIDECAQCDLKLVMLRNRKIFGHSHASEGAASARGSTMSKNEKGVATQNLKPQIEIDHFGDWVLIKIKFLLLVGGVCL